MRADNGAALYLCLKSQNTDIMKQDLKVIGQQELFGKEVAIYGTLENPLFPVKEVGGWLGLKNATMIASRLDKEEVTKFNLGSRQGETLFVTEDGLYEILMQSRKPIAKEFKKGIKRILKELEHRAATSQSEPMTRPKTSWREP